MAWLSVFSWLIHSAVATTTLLACGATAAAMCRQPADRLRVVQCTLAALVVALGLAALPVYPGVWLGVLPAGQTERDTRSGITAPSGLSTAEAAQSSTRLGRPQAANMARISAGEPHRLENGIEKGPGEAVVQGGPIERTSLADLVIRGIVLLYLAGLCVVAGSWARAAWRLRMTRRTAQPAPATIQAALERIAGPDARRVSLLASEMVAAPITWGVFRPVIVLPNGLCVEHDPAKLRYCLAHEWAHVARRDIATWMLATLLQFALYYHPLFWRLRRQLAVSMDQLADAEAAEHGPSMAEYAAFLLNLARRRLGRPPAPALGVSDKRSRLRLRILTLLQSTQPLRRRAGRPLSFAALAAAIALTCVLSAIRLDAESASDADETAAGKQPEFRVRQQYIGDKPIKTLGFATAWGGPRGRYRTQTSEIDDAGLKELRNYPDLGLLELANNPAVTDAGLVHLAGLSELKSLYLGRTSIRGPGLEHISHLKSLEGLSLRDTQLTDDSLKHLAELSNLKWLQLNNTPIGDEALKHLSRLSSLEEVQMSYTEVTDDGIVHLAALSNLKNLSLSGTYVTADGIERLQEALPNCRIYPPPEKLRAEPDDKTLWPEGTKPSRSEFLAIVSALQSPDFPMFEFDTTKPGKPINSFGLFDSNISDASLLRILQEMPDLEQLNLRHVVVGDDLAKELPTRFPKLRSLALGDSRISDEGLKHLGKLVNLRELDLHSNPGITAAGVMELRNLENLESLYISDTRVSDVWFALLQDALPNCQISF